jgi:membrane protein
VLAEGFSSGNVETYSTLHERLDLSLEEMEPVLELMTRADLVRQVKGGGWVLILDPAKITVADIYRLFTFRPEAARAAIAGNARLELLLDEIEAGMNDKMNTSLSQLFNPPSIDNAVT